MSKINGTLFVMGVLSVASLMSGCSDKLAQGYAVGVNLAREQPQSEGNYCESNPRLRMEQVGCRIGFTAYRYGQLLVEGNHNVSKCDGVVSRINDSLREYWNLRPLTSSEVRRVIQTCEAGYQNPRPGMDAGTPTDVSQAL